MDEQQQRLVMIKMAYLLGIGVDELWFRSIKRWIVNFTPFYLTSIKKL